jgi:hypothetical protein
MKHTANWTTTLSPFWAQVRSIVEQAALIRSKGSEREALYELSQDPEAIAIYAGEIGPGQTAVNVAGRVITKFLFNV